MTLVASIGRSLPVVGEIVVAGTSVALAAFLLGRGLTGGVGCLLGAIQQEENGGESAAPGPSRRVRRAVEMAMVLAAVLLFVWEVMLGGLEPRAALAMPNDSMHAAWFASLVRCFAHLLLLAFLAAATWCDLEHRVVPDAITVPGTLLGFACVTALPGILLPVACEQARSFATPLASPDVLGAIGPLACTAHSASLGPMPSLAGLAVTLAAFVLWWLVGTAAGGVSIGRFDPRGWILPIGIMAIVAAWAAGGTGDAGRMHFRALETSIVGAVVSGGLVWMTRAGASVALGKEAMGLGDVTLMAMVGSWCGWQLGVLAFFVAAFLGLGQGLVTWVRHRDNELPFGPSLCLASGLLVVGWPLAWNRVAVFFEQPLLLFTVMGMIVVLTGLSLAVWSGLRHRGGA